MAPPIKTPDPSTNKDEEDWPEPSPRRLLTGTGSLQFEGQSFVPAGEDRAYSLAMEDETLGQLVELLEPTGWQFEFDRFQIEFWGTLTWGGRRYGHLGGYGGIALIDEIVSVEFVRPPPQKGPKYGSLRERLRALKRQRSARSREHCKDPS